MAQIYMTQHFLVETPEQPLMDRNDGGHVTITPKVRIANIQQLTPDQAIELIRLTIVVGQAMTVVMRRNGVDIGRINYQDNGNWGVFRPEGPYQHVHLYGRSKRAKKQKYGQSCYFPHRDDHPEFYNELTPLDPKDVADIHEEIKRLMALDKYSDYTWHLAH